MNDFSSALQRGVPRKVAEEFVMTRHLSRFELARGFVGAASALIICATALFTAAHHLAG